LLQNPNRFLRIRDTRQFDDDLVIASRLNQRLADAETIDPAFERAASAFQRILVNGLAGNRAGLQDDLESSLKIETLMDRMTSPEPLDVKCRTGK
jgi:hypothetical protein